MSLPNKTFCVLPWISLETSPIGTVRPCCLADDEITDDSGRKFNLNDDSLITIQNSTYMEKLRQQFLDGKMPETCRKCWDEEKVGRTSKRMNTQVRLEPLIKDIKEWGQSANDLQFLDLKLGNICNLKCRICGSWSSSTFAAEEIKCSENKEFHRNMNKMGAWPRTATSFWSELDFLSGDIRYLEFTGGEPFMIREHFEFLQRLADKNLASRIEIHYNTNGTQYPKEFLDVWKHFKHVEIAFSIDNVGKRFEYERTGAKWDMVNYNIKKFIKLREENLNISLQLCCTINIYNVLYLEDIFNWEHFQDFNYVHWNMLHDAPQNCIKSLPENAKDAVHDELLMADVDDKTLDEFRNIVDFMYSGKGVSDILNDIVKLDIRRNCTLEDTHKELFDLLYG